LSGGGGYRSGGSSGGGGGYYRRPYRSYTPSTPVYTQESMNALQANIAKKKAEDEAKRAGSFQVAKDGRSWHEYHGVGSLQPDGSIAFNDNTERGRHSHGIHNVDPNNPGNATKAPNERPEGRGW
jgi:hypothetical protein